STHRDLQVSGELQESICRNKTTAYLLNAIPLPLWGRWPAGQRGSALLLAHQDYMTQSYDRIFGNAAGYPRGKFIFGGI
ncbi:hypothetical protein, partial [Sinorhizobium meliloti]